MRVRRKLRRYSKDYLAKKNWDYRPTNFFCQEKTDEVYWRYCDITYLKLRKIDGKCDGIGLKVFPEIKKEPHKETPFCWARVSSQPTKLYKTCARLARKNMKKGLNKVKE